MWISEIVPAGAREGDKGGIKQEQTEKDVKGASWVPNGAHYYACLVERCA